MNQGEITTGRHRLRWIRPLRPAAIHPGARREAGRHGGNKPRRRHTPRQSGSVFPDMQEVDKLLARDDVDMVYIATPPFLHYPQALAALEAGKHVICEKPLAMTLEQADAMIDVARKRGRLLTVNLMQRYNPIFDAVKHLIQCPDAGRSLARIFRKLRFG